MLLDLHGHGHDIQRLELGYLLDSNDLDLGNVQINAPTYAEKSSISQIASRINMADSRINVLLNPGSLL